MKTQSLVSTVSRWISFIVDGTRSGMTLKMLKDYRNMGKLEQNLNASFIALILKIGGAFISYFQYTKKGLLR